METSVRATSGGGVSYRWKHRLEQLENGLELPRHGSLDCVEYLGAIASCAALLRRKL